MQKIGHWILEFDEEAFFAEDLYLYWVVGDESTDRYKSKSFCIAYNENTNNIGFVSYIGSSNNWDNDIEIVETICNKNFPWSKILLLSEKNGGKGHYPEQYYYYVQFTKETDKHEVKRLIQKEIIDDIL